MTELLCTYGDDRDGAIIALLYDDGDESPAERTRFQMHLAACARCQAEVAALRGVRSQLARWSPPEPSFASASSLSNGRLATSPPHWWRQVPAWAQVAAAMVVLGLSAGLANIDIRYDANGLSLRTGWSKPQAPVAPATAPAAPAQLTDSAAAAPWRTDIAALERQLKIQLRATQVAAMATSSPAGRAESATDADLMRRVRGLVDDSEKRQQRELALRIAELLRDVNAQRQADLVRIDRLVRTDVGVQVMKNSQDIDQMKLLYRASQRQ